MAEIVLFHHAQGLTDGVRTFAGELRAAGHTVHVPDLFEGRTFDDLESGVEHAQGIGFDTVRARGVEAAEALPPEIVYAGFSIGVTAAQQLAQTRPGAVGALFMDACLPASEFGAWPEGLPAQIHGSVDDELFAEDLEAARQLADAAPAVELFRYEHAAHLFADASLASYDATNADLLRERATAFLAGLG